MTQTLRALLGGSITVAACYAAGVLLLDVFRARLSRLERLCLAFLLGAACLHLAIFVVFALHVAYWPMVLAPVVAAIAGAIWTGSWRLPKESSPPLPRTLKWFAGLVSAPFSALYFFHALAPETSPDSYHLALIARYLRAHGFERVTSSMYASLGMGAEMLYAPAFFLGRHSAAALVEFAFLLALGGAILAFGIRLGKPWGGAAAALLMYLSPVVGMDGSSSYNDVAAAAAVFGAFYWLEIWDRERSVNLLILAGLMAGYCYAIKYTVAVILVFAVAFVIVRSRKLRDAAVMVAAALTMMLPWMAKDWIFTHNPVAPLGNAIFRNPNVHIDFERAYAEKLSRYDVANKWSLPLEVTIRGAKTNGVIGPVFLLAPLALLALKDRTGRRLLAAAALLLATYLTNVGTRFLIPALPFLALGIAIPLAAWPRLMMALALVHAATSWPAGMRRYVDQGAWGLERVLWKEALRVVPQDEYLRQVKDDYSIALMIEADVPKGEKVLSLGAPVAGDYTSREILPFFESAPNQVLTDMLNVAFIEDLRPVVVRSFHFSARAVTGARVVETENATPQQQEWGVHELHFYHAGVEQRRNPQWKLDARPNRWDAALAFDEVPVTRWRTWELVRAGMFVGAEFNSPVLVDEARVEMSQDSSILPIRLDVEQNGRWITAADQFTETTGAVPPDLRRTASEQMRLQGVRYLLVAEGHYAAADLRENREAWGLTQIGEGFGTRLYKIER